MVFYHPVDLGKHGKGWVERSFQNNIFSLHWGSPITGKTDHPNETRFACDITLCFEGWMSRWAYDRDFQNFNTTHEMAVDNDLIQIAVKEIIANDELNKKLKKWRTDAIKRLKVSVPRLKSEYEAAVDNLSWLENLVI